MDRKLIGKKSVSPARMKADDNNTSTMSRGGEASPLTTGYRPGKNQTRKTEDTSDYAEGMIYVEPKNNKMLDRSPHDEGLSITCRK